MNDKNINIGSVIMQILKASEVSINDFAEAINKHRSDVYYIFKQKSIDVELLIKISKVLKYNFFKEYDYFNEEPENKEKKSIIIIDENKKYRAIIEEI